MQDFSLFPKMEEWGSGDEALDLKLFKALNTATADLSYEAVRAFYEFAIDLKLRVHNPSYRYNVIYITKALLYFLDPLKNINDEFIKLKSNYYELEKVEFDFNEKDILKESLLMSSHYRYLDSIDFFLKEVSESGRNPYLKEKITNNRYELHVKTIFKDMMQFLEGESSLKKYQDELMLLLKDKKVVVIPKVCELWCAKGIIESTPLF